MRWSKKFRSPGCTTNNTADDVRECNDCHVERATLIAFAIEFVASLMGNVP